MYDKAIRMLRVWLPESREVSREEIEEKVNQLCRLEGFQSLDKDRLIREAEAIYRIVIGDFRIIEQTERRKPWLKDKKAQYDWPFWERYRDYLAETKRFSPDVLNKLDRLTDRVLDGLFDPTLKVSIDKKGLVVGQVQSGKTSNYIGLICKAADAGFKFIIVLAGMHNNLRSQTQLRIDESFLGFDTQHTRAYDQNNILMGVGRSKHTEVAHSLTSSLDNGDFKRAVANSLGFNFNTNDPIIAVVKKNTSVLRTLYQWLAAQPTKVNDERKISRKSLLLIDDEADNASINISNNPQSKSTINNWINQIIGLFTKSAYVGYTATPFANIFIPPEADDLFPRDFIINIPAPSNYIGSDKVFGFQFTEENDESDSVLPVINRIADYSDFVPDRHKRDDQLPSEIPQSLKLAIRCFILTCAIRRLRGQDKVHNSMLIHISRFQRWQNHITYLVQNQLDFYRMGIDQNDAQTLEAFRATFEDDSLNYKSFITVSNQILNSSLSDIDPQIQTHNWEDVIEHLNEAVQRIEVREINGGSGEVLDYYDHRETGLSVITIGGNKLSRGLTLEGLSVSYYLRASRMYDTLMQMGRWFGYRPGYVDLCRLFTSCELNEWFCHITRASEELKDEFNYMSDIAGTTPEQYALRVRTHPGILQISASNKMRSAVKVHISHAGRLVESYEFKRKIHIIDSNFEHTKAYFTSLPNTNQKNGNFLWYDRPAEEIMNFLAGIQTPENLKAYEPHILNRFIRDQLKNGELTSWRVGLISKRNAKNFVEFTINNTNIKVGCLRRTEDENNSDKDTYYLKKSHIISPQDEFLDLSPQEYESAMQLTQEYRENQNNPKAPSYPRGEIVRNQMRDPRHPLLLIYLLDPQEMKSKHPLPEGTNPFVGYAISFPRSEYNTQTIYAVNEQLLDKFNVEDNLEDFHEDDED